MCCAIALFSISLTLHNLECFPCYVVHLHHTFKSVMFSNPTYAVMELRIQVILNTLPYDFLSNQTFHWSSVQCLSHTLQFYL